jgi:hypothetical protein
VAISPLKRRKYNERRKEARRSREILKKIWKEKL